jgi:hypothetical protein
VILSALAAHLSPTPRSIQDTDNPRLRVALADQLRKPTDVILALELGMAAFLPPATPGVPPAVVDQVEVSGQALAVASAGSAREGLRHRLTQVKSDRFWRRVLRACCRAVTAVSNEEAEAVRQVIGGDGPPVVVVPNGVDVSSYRRGASGTAPISGRLLYNGALGYGPNRDAVSWFVREMLPRIANQAPAAHLVVTGRTDDVDEETCSVLHADPRVQMTGFVPDLRPVLDQANLCVIPLRQGGGTRLKILEAFAAGLPVVSTTRGAAGIEAEHGHHLLLADTPEDLAACVVRLLQKPDEAMRLARAARHLVEVRYNWPDIAGLLSQLLEQVTGGTPDDTVPTPPARGHRADKGGVLPPTPGKHNSAPTAPPSSVTRTGAHTINAFLK